MADSQRLQQLAAAPASPVKGTVYFDTVKNAIGVYNGTVWVYGSATAWGPSGGTTEIDGNLTLGGKPVSAVPPTSGGPYYLEYNGTDWIAATVSGGGSSELNGDTLNGKTIAATTPTAGFPYALVYNGTDWVSEAVVASGGGASRLGNKLISDASGNGYWEDDTNDTLQPGYVGLVNPGIISAAIAAGGALTFTHWPAPVGSVPGDAVWFPVGSGSLPQTRMRATAPAAPSLTVSGVTSGDWAYVYVYLATPTTPGGTPVATLVVGTSRTTAALAAADQVGIAYGTSGVMVWDGVVKNTGGTYTLVGGTPASGSTIPAAGRDRRLWAKGSSFFKTATGSAAVSSVTGADVAIDTGNLAFRVECSGLPIYLKYSTFITPNATATVEGTWLMDGSPSGMAVTVYNGSNGVIINFVCEAGITPAAGSHLFEPAWLTTAGTLTNNGGGSDLVQVREVPGGSQNNGTA